MRFVADTEHRSQVIEHISTAVSANLSKRFAAIDPVVAIQVGASMVAIGVTAGVGSAGLVALAPQLVAAGAVYAAVIAVLVLAVALLLLMRATHGQDRRAGDILLLSGLAPLSVAAASAPPGPVGSPHAVMGFGVLAVAAMLALRFTGRRLGIYTAIVTISFGGDDREPGPDGREHQRGDAVDQRRAGLRVRLPRRAGAVPLVVRYPAAGVPVGHQSLGVRGPARPADHRGALRRRPAGPGGPRVGPRRGAAGRARPVVPDRLLVGLGVLMIVSLTALSRPAHRDTLAAAAAGRLHRGLPDAAWPLVRRPLAGDHPGR